MDAENPIKFDYQIELLIDSLKMKIPHVKGNKHIIEKIEALRFLPNTDNNPIEFQRPEYSKIYSLMNMQITYNLKYFEIYTGCENIFDYRQKQPIINWQNPFGQYFDTSSVWGPTRGREIYIGIRYKI